MLCKDTLLFKNWPPELTDVEKQEFLVHFGAKTVKSITSKCKQNTKTFAKFETEEQAKGVMNRLHQINVLGSFLSVEYAKEEIGCEKVPKSFLESDFDKHFTIFLNKLNSWNNSVSFNQPPPPHLKYSYPKANRATINNIAHALATVPKFYTQVLHLMNRMNLPPPFSNIPDPPIPNPEPAPEKVPTPQKSSSEESEYESDPDDIEQRVKEIIPEKRKKKQKTVMKKAKFTKPQAVVVPTKPAQNPEEVFETVPIQSKKIELKLSETLEIKEDSSNILNESFGTIPSTKPAPSLTETPETTTEELKLLTDLELAENRISPKDFGLLPVFKDYHPGAPNCRLYIKNLSKTVTVKDLEQIYRRYDPPIEAEQGGNMFDIRLMQEGRMKGQAFVTLQNVELAQRAVKETNGYILKSKPVVVVFARSATPKQK